MEITDYCDYKLSLALKECGFDEPCRCCYIVDKDTESNIEFTEYASRSKWNSAEIGGSKYPYKHISAPTLWQAQKWLREKKGIAINVIAHDCSDKYRGGKYHWMEVYLPNCNENGPQWMDWFIYGKHPLFNTYEEALSDGLSQMLELINKGE